MSVKLRGMGMATEDAREMAAGSARLRQLEAERFRTAGRYGRGDALGG